jgi:hypothetical protein
MEPHRKVPHCLKQEASLKAPKNRTVQNVFSEFRRFNQVLLTGHSEARKPKLANI